MDMATPKLQHAFTLKLRYETPHRYPSTTGNRASLQIAEGSADGPLLTAEVADDGGELLIIRPDGVLELDSRIMLRAADGTMIYWRALGFVNAGADRAAAFFAGEDLAPASMEAAPYFDAPQGERDWMTCRSFIARGTLGSRSAEIDVFRMQPE